MSVGGGTKLCAVILVASLNGAQSCVDPQPPCRSYFVRPSCLCNEQSRLTSVWFSWRKRNCPCWTWLPGKFNSVRVRCGCDLEVQLFCGSARFVSGTWVKSVGAGMFPVSWNSTACQAHSSRNIQRSLKQFLPLHLLNQLLPVTLYHFTVIYRFQVLEGCAVIRADMVLNCICSSQMSTG